MKLTEEEKRWLNRWEKRERRWPVTRWGGIFLGLLSIAVGIFIFHGMIATGNPYIVSLLFIPFFFLGLGGVFFGVAINSWRGDIKLRLLLRLIREHEDKDA